MSEFADNIKNQVAAIDARQDAALGRIQTANTTLRDILSRQRKAAQQLIERLKAETELTLEARQLVTDFMAEIEANTQAAEQTATDEESANAGETVIDNPSPTDGMTDDQIAFVRKYKTSGAGFEKTAEAYKINYGVELTETQFKAV